MTGMVDLLRQTDAMALAHPRSQKHTDSQSLRTRVSVAWGTSAGEFHFSGRSPQPLQLQGTLSLPPAPFVLHYSARTTF